MDLQIILERRSARDHRAAFAEGPQPQVYAEYESVLGRLLEQAQQQLREAREVLLIAERLRAVTLPVLGIQQHQVDVG